MEKQQEKQQEKQPEILQMGDILEKQSEMLKIKESEYDIKKMIDENDKKIQERIYNGESK